MGHQVNVEKEAKVDLQALLVPQACLVSLVLQVYKVLPAKKEEQVTRDPRAIEV